MIANVWQWLIVLLVQMFLFWVSRRISLWEGRMIGRREIALRNQEQQRAAHRRGQSEALRRAAIWLRQHGCRKESLVMPMQVLDPEESQEETAWP